VWLFVTERTEQSISNVHDANGMSKSGAFGTMESKGDYPELMDTSEALKLLAVN
jgi:hypothetical protein